MNLKYFVLSLLLVLKFEHLQAIMEGSLVVKMKQRFCTMLIYDDSEDSELSINNIIARSSSIVISDELKPVFLSNPHEEALITICVDDLKNKLTKSTILDENYFFHLNYILIGCYDDIKYVNTNDIKSKQDIQESFIKKLDSALVTNGFIINYNNIILCNTDELLAKMALEFSHHKGINSSTNNNNLLVLNAETGYNLNTECMCIQTNKYNQKKINFITEARTNIIEKPFDKNISFLYYFNYITNSKAKPRLHLFQKPFHIYKVYQLIKHEVLDFILVLNNVDFNDSLYLTDNLHKTKIHDSLLDAKNNNLDVISNLVNTNIDVINIWMTESKADYTILIGELLLSNSIFSFYQQYLIEKFAKSATKKIYITSKKDFYLALMLASQKIKADTNIIQKSSLTYKIWKFATTTGEN